MSDLVADQVLYAIDLCSGAGGWACAALGLPIKIVLAVDLWDVACQTYRLNHGFNQHCTEVFQGDLREAETQQKVMAVANQYPRDRLIFLGGIPCEWLSTYRHLQKVKPAELEKERATLDTCLALRDQVQPRWWCFEDVPQIQKHLPLMTPGQLINARNYSAQRRKRFFVGDFPPPALQACSQTLKHKVRPGPYRIGSRAYGRTPQTHRTFTPEATLGAWLHRKGPTVACISSRRDAEWVVVDDSVPGGIRQIEWQEAAALQGFPESYLFYGSPGDVATQIGRAIQIDTGRAILTSMCRVAFGYKEKVDVEVKVKPRATKKLQGKRVGRPAGRAKKQARKPGRKPGARGKKNAGAARRVPGRKARQRD